MGRITWGAIQTRRNAIHAGCAMGAASFQDGVPAPDALARFRSQRLGAAMRDKPPVLPAKIYHRAKLINSRGGVSPLCAKVPKSLNLKREMWTIVDRDVTCPRCLEKIRARVAQ